jgi:hypothetical protein
MGREGGKATSFSRFFPRGVAVKAEGEATGELGEGTRTKDGCEARVRVREV